MLPMTKLPNKTSLAEQKSLLRAEIRRLKQLQLPDDLQVWSTAFCEKVMALPEWQSARTVLLYAALPDEVQTLSLQDLQAMLPLTLSRTVLRRESPFFLPSTSLRKISSHPLTTSSVSFTESAAPTTSTTLATVVFAA